MRYDRHNLIGVVKKDLHNYDCPQCRSGSFNFAALDYMIGGPITVDVRCYSCGKEQIIKFHVDVV